MLQEESLIVNTKMLSLIKKKKLNDKQKKFIEIEYKGTQTHTSTCK